MTTTPNGGAPDHGASSAEAGPHASLLGRASHASAPGERWKLAAAWLVVGLPAAWGVSQVVLKSLALFR